MQINAYDRNGLELSPMSDTLNAYKMTAMDTSIKKVIAYARSSHTGKQVSIFTIGLFKDPRDAAYIAQEFAKVYTKDQVKQMVIDRTLRETAKRFIAATDIPEWKYPAEGITFEDIECDYGYKRNRVEDARAALVEALHIFQKKAPILKEVPALISAVKKKYEAGMSYRQAAKEVVAAL